MATQHENNDGDVGGVLRTVGVLLLAITLESYVTGSLSGAWTIFMTSVMVSLFAGITVRQMHQKSKVK